MITSRPALASVLMVAGFGTASVGVATPGDAVLFLDYEWTREIGGQSVAFTLRSIITAIAGILGIVGVIIKLVRGPK